MKTDNGGNGLPSGLIDLDRAAEARPHHWSIGNAGILASMAIAIALLAAAGGAVASHAWAASHPDEQITTPATRVLAFAEAPAELTVSAEDGSTQGFTGHISVISTEPRTVRIIRLQANESGLSLSSLPLPSSDRHYDIPPDGAISIAVSLSMQCSSETPLSAISLKLDAYALEGQDVRGVPQSASLNILPWRDYIELACSIR